MESQPSLPAPGFIQQNAESLDYYEYQGVTDITIDRDTAHYVYTPDFVEATDLLENKGQVILCGPPGCGKTTLANALLRQSRDEGFTPHIISRLEEWTDSVGVGRSAVVLDFTLGKVRVDRQQYDLWRDKRPGLNAVVNKGDCRLILVVYPHVLRELKELEGAVDSPLADRSLVVEVGACLTGWLRDKMLRWHLRKLCLEPSQSEELVAAVLASDCSGRGFPWCCGHFVEHWLASSSTAIFSAPEETHALLIKEMVAHVTHGQYFAAVLALMMRGFTHFLHTTRRAQSFLGFVGFGTLQDDKLAEYADVLRGSILTESGDGFISRDLYNAAALAVGRSFRLPTMLKACDAAFLVQHVRTSVVAGRLAGAREPDSKLCISLGLPNCSAALRPVQTTPQDLESLTEKVCEEIISGHLVQVCQHPSLQCPKFLLALEQYCRVHSVNHSALHLVSMLDPLHRLPLVYWSVFCPSDTFTQWCLRIMVESQSGASLLSLPVLLACGVFDQMTGNCANRLQSLLQGALGSEHMGYDQDTVELPLMGRRQCLTPECGQFHDAITEPQSEGRKLLYLCDSALPIPTDVVSIQVCGEKVKVQVRDKRLWYLVHRLLADREVDRRDREGNTLLHLAIRSGDCSMIQLAIRSGSSLLEKTDTGETAYHLAQSKRSLQRQGSINDYFKALNTGNEVLAKTLLCHSVSVHDTDVHGNTSLHVACRRGQEDMADMLIRLGAALSANSRDHRSPLHHAYQSGSPALVSLLVHSGAEVSLVHRTVVCSEAEALAALLQQGADPNQHDPDLECGPLHVACMLGRLDLVRCLFEYGGLVSGVDGGSCTPLHRACRHGHTQVAQYLVQKGADVNVSNSKGMTPLHLACGEGHTDTALCLIMEGAQVDAADSGGSTALHKACTAGHLHTVQCLLQHQASINTQDMSGATPLHKACLGGHHQTAACLLRHGAHHHAKDKYQSTPLHKACKSGDFQTVLCLTDGGADVNAEDAEQCAPLHKACETSDTCIVQHLIKQDAHVNAEDSDQSTPLHVACEKGHHQTALCLISNGASVNAADSSKCTPLHKACTNGHHDTVLNLLNHSANVNAKDIGQSTPLHKASENPNPHTVSCLLEQGARINAEDISRSTALHRACEKGQHETAKCLLEQKAEVNCKDIKEFTPLHRACENGHPQVVECLLRYGAKVTSRASLWGTPLDLARRRRHDDIIQLLTDFLSASS